MTKEGFYENRNLSINTPFRAFDLYWVGVDGRRIGFGPFVGYYFRPEDPRNLSRLQFVCFNENKFYSSDMPDGARLYEGTAVRTTLPEPQFEMLHYKDSITG